MLAKSLLEDSQEYVAIKIFEFKKDNSGVEDPSLKSLSGTEDAEMQNEGQDTNMTLDTQIRLSRSCAPSNISNMTSKSLHRYGAARHFNTEVFFLTKLTHPNIVRVIESASYIKIPKPLSFVNPTSK